MMKDDDDNNNDGVDAALSECDVLVMVSTEDAVRDHHHDHDGHDDDKRDPIAYERGRDSTKIMERYIALYNTRKTMSKKRHNVGKERNGREDDEVYDDDNNGCYGATSTQDAPSSASSSPPSKVSVMVYPEIWCFSRDSLDVFGGIRGQEKERHSSPPSSSSSTSTTDSPPRRNDDGDGQRDGRRRRGSSSDATIKWYLDRVDVMYRHIVVPTSPPAGTYCGGTVTKAPTATHAPSPPPQGQGQRQQRNADAAEAVAAAAARNAVRLASFFIYRDFRYVPTIPIHRPSYRVVHADADADDGNDISSNNDKHIDKIIDARDKLDDDKNKGNNNDDAYEHKLHDLLVRDGLLLSVPELLVRHFLRYLRITISGRSMNPPPYPPSASQQSYGRCK